MKTYKRVAMSVCLISFFSLGCETKKSDHSDLRKPLKKSLPPERDTAEGTSPRGDHEPGRAPQHSDNQRSSKQKTCKKFFLSLQDGFEKDYWTHVKLDGVELFYGRATSCPILGLAASLSLQLCSEQSMLVITVERPKEPTISISKIIQINEDKHIGVSIGMQDKYEILQQKGPFYYE